MLHADATLIAALDEPSSPRWLEHVGLAAIFGVAAALQFSIAAAQTLLAIAIACWLALVVSRRERVEVPRFFWPLAALAALTFVSAAFSPQPRVSFADTKQLLLFLIVPLTYRFLRGNRGGPGNPHARRAWATRRALTDCITDAQLKAMVDALIARAEAGDFYALREIWNRLEGKPRRTGGEP